MTQRPTRLALGEVDELLASRFPDAALVMHSGCAEPPRLAERLAAVADRMAGARVYSLMPMAEPAYAAAGSHGGLVLKTFFPGHGLRAAVADGRAEVLRVPLSLIPRLFASGTLTPDVALLQVSPPGADGRVSLGVSVDYLPAVLACRPTVVAEINPCMPHTHGESRLPLDALDYVVECDHPVVTVAPPPDDPVDRRIAAHVAGLVRDGAVIQTGIGSIPTRVLGELGHLRGLRVHSGIVTDALLGLRWAGALAEDGGHGHRSAVVTAMAAGTAAFYDYLHDNPEVEFRSCAHTHDPAVLAALDDLCAINGALQVDLAGNVNAERSGGRTVAAPGGLPDFARGAIAARRGISVIALRSTTRGGTASAIVPELPADVPRTVTGAEVDYVVTEHGVARVRGLSAAARARALAGIADPAFRAGLSRGTASTAV